MTLDFYFALFAGALAGILSAFGVGGGTLLLLYMTSVAGMEQHLAQGINLLYFIPTAAASLPSHIKNGYVERSAALPAILAGLTCAALSAWFSIGLDTTLLRKCFGVFLLLVGFSELFSKQVRE